MINIDLSRRKSFGCVTRVVHKSSWAKLKPRHATPQKEINIGKNTTSSSEMKIIFYSFNTTHEWFRFKKRFEVSKIAVAGHGTRYLFRLTFSRIISIFAILLSQCLFAKRIEKKTPITQTIVCRLIFSVLQTNSVFSRFMLLSSSNSANYQWIQVEWSGAFSKHPKKPLSGESSGSKIFPQVERWGTKIRHEHEPVSYTHLTLPTKRIV